MTYTYEDLPRKGLTVSFDNIKPGDHVLIYDKNIFKLLICFELRIILKMTSDRMLKHASSINCSLLEQHDYLERFSLYSFIPKEAPNTFKEKLDAEYQPAYRTPEVEEFRIGFEFECQENSPMSWNMKFSNDKEWIKNVVKIGDTLPVGKSIRIRTKVFDYKDAEDLGWKMVNQTESKKSYMLTIKDYNPDGPIYDMICGRDGECHIYGRNVMVGDTIVKRSMPLFSGRLKHKLELRDLMMQIGIQIR